MANPTQPHGWSFKRLMTEIDHQPSTTTPIDSSPTNCQTQPETLSDTNAHTHGNVESLTAGGLLPSLKTAQEGKINLVHRIDVQKTNYKGHQGLSLVKKEAVMQPDRKQAHRQSVLDQETLTAKHSSTATPSAWPHQGIAPPNLSSPMQQLQGTLSNRAPQHLHRTPPQGLSLQASGNTFPSSASRTGAQSRAPSTGPSRGLPIGRGGGLNSAQSRGRGGRANAQPAIHSRADRQPPSPIPGIHARSQPRGRGNAAFCGARGARTAQQTAGLPSPTGISARAQAQWQRLHVLHHNGESLDEEEGKEKARANKAALEAQDAKRRAVLKRQKLQLREDTGQLASDFARVITGDFIRELDARVDGTKLSVAKVLPPAQQEPQHSLDDPMDMVDEQSTYMDTEVPYEDEEGYFVYYTEDGLPYYFDDKGNAQWRYPEEDSQVEDEEGEAN